MNIRKSIVLVFCFFLCSISFAEVYTYTNVVTSLSPSTHPLSFDRQFNGRYTVYARNAGGSAVNMSSYTLAWEIRRLADGVIEGLFPVEVVDAAAGQVRATAIWTAMEPGTYKGKLIKYLSETNYDGYIAEDFITLYDGCDACATTSSNNISITNITIIGSVVVTNIITNIVNNTIINTITGLIANVNVSNVTVAGGITIDGGVGVTSDAINVYNDHLELSSDGRLRPNDTDRSVNPKNNDVSDFGSDTQRWHKGHFTEVMVGGVSVAPVPRPTAPTAQILQWSGSAIFWGTPYGPTIPNIGTNRVFFTNNVASGISYTWTVPAGVTSVQWWAWGAAGTSGGSGPGGGGGLVFATMSVIPGSQYDVVIANGATNGATGINGGGSRVGTGANGGGYAALYVGGTTTLVFVAAGGGGGWSSSGGGGGGISGGDGTVFSTPTNYYIGKGATGTTVYAGQTSATNVNTFANGSFLQGGNASTNGFSATGTIRMGGGGGGYGGGAGAAITNNTASTLDIGGGGGVSWANSNLVSFASTVRAINGTPAGQELPAYVSGRAVGGTSAGNGGAAMMTVEY